MRSLLDAVVGFFRRRNAARDDAEAAKADSDLREYWRAPVTVSHGIVTDEDHATAPAEALPDPASMSLADRMHFSFLAEQEQAAAMESMLEHEEATARFWEEMEEQRRFWDDFDEDFKRRWEDDSSPDDEPWLHDTSITDDIQQALDDD